MLNIIYHHICELCSDHLNKKKKAKKRKIDNKQTKDFLFFLDDNKASPSVMISQMKGLFDMDECEAGVKGTAASWHLPRTVCGTWNSACVVASSVSHPNVSQRISQPC